MIDPLHLLVALGAGFTPLALLGFAACRQSVVHAIFCVVILAGVNALAHQFFAQSNLWEVGAFLLGGLPGVAAGIAAARYSMKKKKPAGLVAVPRKQRARPVSA